jgi:hypothetical protein
LSEVTTTDPFLFAKFRCLSARIGNMKSPSICWSELIVGFCG